MKEVWCLVDSQGYEALYVDKELVEEGNPLNGGIERVRYFISLAKNYQRTEILLQLCERSLKYLSSTHLNIEVLKKGLDN